MSQRLLFPIEIHVSNKEIAQLKNIEIDLLNFGFDVEFGEESLLIHALSTEVTAENVPSIFSDFLQELEWHEKVNFNTEISKIIAKNTAIKKGEVLLPEQSKHLAQQLLQLESPNFSPYGKPVFLQLSESEVFKKLN